MSDAVRQKVDGLLAMLRGLAQGEVAAPGLWEDLARDVVRLHAELTLTLFKERRPNDMPDDPATAGLPPGAMACVMLAPAIEALKHAPPGVQLPPKALALIAVAEEAGMVAKGRPS